MTYIFTDVDKRFFHVKGTKTAQQVIDSVTGNRDSQSDNSLSKNAASTALTGGGSFAGSQIMYSSPSFYSPLHTAINWQIPTKRREIYMWNVDSTGLMMYEDLVFSPISEFEFEPTEITEDTLTDGIVYENIKSEKIFGGQAQLRQPVNFFERPCTDKRFVKIKTNGYYNALSVSEEHNVYIINGKNLRRDVKNYGCKLYREGFRGNTDKKDFIQRTEWDIDRIESQNIMVGDFLLTPIPKNEIQYINLSNEDFWTIGLIIADGSLHGEKKDILSLNVNINEMNDYKYILKDTIEYVSDILHSNSKKCYRITKKSPKINQYSKFITGKLASKKFKKEIRNLSKEQMLHILGGYFDGDGSFDKNNHKLIANNCSKDMSDQLYFMLLMCGISCSLNKYPHYNNYEDEDQGKSYGHTSEWVYRLFIPSSEVHKLRPYMKSNKIPEDFEYSGHDRVLGFFTKDKDGVEYFARSVQSIEEFEYNGIGYDIQIDPERSYVCSGFKVSNCRFFSDNEPTIKAALRFYKEFPFHGYENVMNDPIRKEHFDKLKDNLNIDKILPMVAYEYFTMGDAFPFISFSCEKCDGFGLKPNGEVCDHEGGSIAGITCLNPDWIDVQLNPLLPMDPVINLVPDDSLRQIILSKKPIEIYEKIPPHLRKKILQNQPILLSPRSVTHLKHDEVSYIGYGRSIIAPLFPILAYQDKLRQAQWIVADRHILPIKICKVGNDQRPASAADIRDTQNQLAQTANDPNLTLVTHHAFDFCHDDQTEVLTENGWKKYWEVDDDEKIMIFDQETENIYLENFVNRFESSYDGEMVCFNNNNIDIKVTPHHKMLFQESRKDEWKIGYASEIDEKQEVNFMSIINLETDYTEFIPEFSVIKKEQITRNHYNGLIWCFETTTGFFVTRRNGKITIQGNSWEGAAGKVLQLTKEYELIDQSIIKGLGVNSALLSGEGPSYSWSIDTNILTHRGFVSCDDFDEENDLVATFNKETGALEYQKVEEKYVYDWDSIDGDDPDLYHFKTNRIDLVCTPNHRMLIKTRQDKEKGDDKWQVVRANKVKNRMSFRASVDKWNGSISDDIDDKCLGLEINDFLQLSGLFISEGSYRKDTRNKDKLKRYLHNGNLRNFSEKTGITISVNTETSPSDVMKNIFSKIVKKDIYKTSTNTRILKSNLEQTTFLIYNKNLANIFEEYFGEYSEGKKIPIWMKNLPTDKLQILLDSLVAGDGNIRDATKKKETDKKYYTYNTTSKQLRDDVMEIVIKLGRSPRFNKKDAVNENSQDIWVVYWSDSDLVGLFPSLESKDKENKNIPCIHKIPYKGRVWCVRVKNSFFVSERNGLIAIHGNSTAAIGIEATIKRLKTVQNMMAKWICDKIYKAEAKMRGFYKKDLSGNKVLDYPEIRWADLNLRDESQRNNFYMQLWKEQIVSTQFICEKTNIDYDVELERVRLENVFRQQAGLVGPGGDEAGGGGGLMGGSGGIGGGGGGMGSGFKDQNKGNLPGGQSGPGLPGDELAPSMSGGESVSGGQPSGGAPMAAYETQLKNYNQAQQYSPVVTRKVRIKEPQEPRVPIEQVDLSVVPETGFRLTSLEQTIYVKIEEGQKAGNLPMDFYIQQKPEPVRMPKVKVDFMSPTLRLIIQADGKQFHSSDEDVSKDIDIDARFARCGWRVLRFTEDEIQQSSDAVLSKIIQTCNEITKELEQAAETNGFFKKAWAEGGYCHKDRDYFDDVEIDEAFLKTSQTKNAHQLEAISEDLEELDEDFEKIISIKEEMENLIPE